MNLVYYHFGYKKKNVFVHFTFAHMKSFDFLLIKFCFIAVQYVADVCKHNALNCGV